MPADRAAKSAPPWSEPPVSPTLTSGLGGVVAPLDRFVATLVAKPLARAGAELILWDGAVVPGGPPSPSSRVRIDDRFTLVACAVDPDLRFGEAYADGRLTVDGDLVELLERAGRAAARGGRLRVGWLARWRGRARHIGRPKARENALSHYDLGNDFFAGWLDPSMTYTCAYFERPDQSLAQAQRAKLELVCRKLALQPGERVVEAGSGWGALALHMAAHYGVEVTAYNVSREQLAWARRSACERGLGDRVRFVEGDWREIRGRHDVFVSVGMLEAVGRRHYRELGRLIDRCLTADGRGLLHSIGRARPAPTNAWIDRYVFPDGYTPALSEMLGVLDAASMTVTHVENLRDHYARTLALWRDAFESYARGDEARLPLRFVRLWRLYLAAAEASFRSGWLELYQAVFERPGRR